MIKIKYALYAIATLTIVPLTDLQAQSLEPISIAYKVSMVSDKYGNATLGKAQTTLTKTDTGFSAVSQTKAQGIAAILLGSNFQESCDFVIEHDQVVSDNYSGGRRDNTDYQVNFDWKDRKIKFSDGESLDMPKGYVVDNCNMPFAAAMLKGDGLSKQTLYIVDGKSKRIRGYNLKSTNEEILETNFGEIETVKVVLERELIPERTITLWLSPQNSHVPLKMEERRKKRTTTMMVDKIDS